MDANWGAIGSIGGMCLGVIAWFNRLERRLNGKLDVAVHEKICEKSSLELKACLLKIDDTLEKRDRKDELHQEKQSQFRHEIRNQLNTINIKLAVISRDNPKRLFSGD